MKKKAVIFILIACFLIITGALAVGSMDNAYQQAVKEAGATTAALVESIDLSEFEDHFGLDLTEDEEILVRMALMTYSNGAILEHPVGVNNIQRATILEDPYVGNKNSHKFHYSWCSSVSDITEKNKVTFSSREEATQAGYKPCKRCNP